MRRTKTVQTPGAARRTKQGAESRDGRASTSRGNFTPPPADGRARSGPPGDQDEAPPTGSGSRLALHNWRVPTRLVAILIVPVIAGLIFAGLRVNSSVSFAQQADEAERVAKLARSATTLADALQNERDSTALPLTRGDRANPEIRKAYDRTDAALRAYRADAKAVGSDNERVDTRIKAADVNLATLQTLRKDAYNPDLMPLATQQAYSEMFRPLMAFDNELGFGSTKVTSRGRAVYAISLAKASASTARDLVQTALARDLMTPYDPVAIQAAVTLQQTAYAEFLSGALPQDVRLYNETTGAYDGRPMEAFLGRLLANKPGKSLSAAGLTPAEWYKVSSVNIDLMRKVELGITDGIVQDAADIRSEAERDAMINGAGALLAVAVAALLTFLISRSMVRGMSTLRTSAIGIAENRLPSLVESLSKTDPERVDTRVKPIPLFGRDEIGEVARAFDQVHKEAVRLAAEQALLRGNVNAIFTNLSRRNQGLIQRQLTLITDLENNETDPDQLENLFRMDHLATRMRRNGENLLVLAGEEPGRRWTQPVPLVDVLRAAASEVEQYERVELVGIPETEIHGTAVNDLVHLLAELLENATSFSSPQTKVRVNGTRLPDGRVMIEIHDKGIGLTPEDFADINHKLANPPTVDVSIARRMGLFVVGRLSARHGIRVQLRPSGESAGTTSLVMLPEPITHGGGAPEPEPDFEVSRIVPEQDTGTYQLDSRSAAEFGFDDSRYEASPAALDPVNRSLQRQERRAALEAAANGAPGEDAAAYEGQPPFLDDRYAEPQPQAAAQAQEEQGDQVYDQYADEGAYATDGGAYPAAGGPAPFADDHQYSEDGQAYADDAQYADSGPYAGADPYAGDGQYAADDGAYAGTPPYQGEDRYDGGGQYADEGGYAEEPQYAADGAAYPSDGTEYGGGQQGYDEQPFGQPGYDEQDYAAAAGFPGTDGAGFGDQQSFAPEETEEPFSPFGHPTAKPGPGMGTPRNGFGTGGYRSAPSNESVGFTDSGLPRRQPQWQKKLAEETADSARPAQNTDGATSVEDDEWRSANDQNWQRASQIRKPQAGGVTASGLPMRVPKANLVPGHAQQTPQGGAQVSRAPDEVRGRLTSLRRGIQRGRSAGGTDSNGAGFGPTDDQER